MRKRRPKHGFQRGIHRVRRRLKGWQVFYHPPCVKGDWCPITMLALRDWPKNKPRFVQYSCNLTLTHSSHSAGRPFIPSLRRISHHESQRSTGRTLSLRTPLLRATRSSASPLLEFCSLSRAISNPISPWKHPPPRAPGPVAFHTVPTKCTIVAHPSRVPKASRISFLRGEGGSLTTS